MPTGHSSGGGSSHSGGSFGGGSSHSTGGAWRGGPMPHGRGVVIINNRPYRMGGGASAGFFGCVFLAVVFIFMAFAGGIMMGNASNTKRKIEYDFINYKDIVTVAKKHEDRIVTGEIKSIEPGYGRFRIIYEFNYRGRDIEGYTFYVYTSEKLDELDYEVSEAIDIALDLSYMVLGEPDSIPLDFDQFEVGDDGEYLRANRNFKIGIALLICGIALTVACFIVGNVIKTKFAKPYERNAGETNETQPKKENSEQATYCEYCGARLKPGEDKCPECGARRGK